MPLPEPVLDDLRFQRVVDEARRRIIRYCPEWTDYNLSDPGITLIELFAWMTEVIGYRLNQVPEKNYLRFLDLLGVRLKPATSARGTATFYLSARFPLNPEEDITAVIPQGFEVATRRTEEDPELIFTTDDRLNILSPRLTELRREAEFNKNYQPRLGVEVFQPFHPRPRPGDTAYFGFAAERDLSGHILQLHFECEETQATGVRRSDPPWVWECSLGEGRWQEIAPSTLPGERDTTGGLNNPRGQLTLYLPLEAKPDQVFGRPAYWVRCRVEQRRPEQGMFTESPRVRSVLAYTIGATTRVTHAVIVRAERLGVSSGEPGQLYRLLNAPVLTPTPLETLEVEETRDNETVFVPWTLVADFADSDPFDRHYTLDTATGEVAFGPLVRQPDGGMKQYGRVPEAGRAIQFSQYRYGGGAAGNVPRGKLQVLKSAIPYVDRVVNHGAAEGGRDSESLDEAKLRARREVHSQQRAVTAEDFENLAKDAATRAVARAKCRTPGAAGAGGLAPGVVELAVVPAAFDSLRAGDLSKLFLEPDLARQVQAHLDRFRLLTTTLRIREPEYIGVRVEAEIAVDEYVQPEAVRDRVTLRLRQFLSPLAIGPAEGAGGLMEADWEGWPFGRTLFLSELYTLIQQVPGVKHVLEVRVAQRPVTPAAERREPGEEAAPAPAVTPLSGRRLDIPALAVLCSLDHAVTVVEL